MATLAPSLRLLFAELDSHWPKRDRRTDGWYRPPSMCTRPSDHCADSRGRVRAIDIDKDGIDPDYVVGQIISDALPTEYVIWNRHIWSRSYDWRKRKYTGTSNPHTDHIHVSISHTDRAWSYKSGWGIAKGGAGFGAAPGVEDVAADWGFQPQVQEGVNWVDDTSVMVNNYGGLMRNLRR